jgi:RES domain-containing protein
VKPPRTTRIDQRDTHRFVASKYREDGASVLLRIADDDAHLRAIFDLDNATNERLLAENDLLPGIGADELVFKIPRYRIVNAAFCHAHPEGSRFNGHPDRGAWYAGFDLATAQAEVIFHTTVALAEIECFEDSVTCDDYLADFAGEFHDIRDEPAHHDCLAPDSYVASQALAAYLLERGSVGIVYPSARRRGGTNLACFRPAMVGNVRLGPTYRLTWRGDPTPTVELEIAR